MTKSTISSLLSGTTSVGTRVTVKGWVRSKRDSKAGISFIAIHDGSCFDAIQAVVPNDLDNYEDEVLKISTGAAVVIEGELVESQGKGQSVEIHAQSVEVVGWVDEPETYPIAKKRHTFEYLRSVAHLRHAQTPSALSHGFAQPLPIQFIITSLIMISIGSIHPSLLPVTAKEQESFFVSARSMQPICRLALMAKLTTARIFSVAIHF